MPSASSCFLPVFGFRKVTQESSSEKSENYRNSFSPEEPRSQKGRPNGATQGLGRPCARVGVDPRRGPAPSPRIPPYAADFPYLYLRRETAETRIVFQKKDPRHRHHQTLVSGVRKLRPGTLPGRGLVPEAISIDAAASMMLRE